MKYAEVENLDRDVREVLIEQLNEEAQPEP